MTSRRSLVRRGAALVAVVTGIAVAVWVARPHGGQPDATPAKASVMVSTPSATPIQKVMPIGVPDHLTIPAIGVKARVVPVGTSPQGAQSVPPSIDVTGWWRDGRQPGQSGNAVIVGHTASKADGVFDHLSELNVGDAIAVSSGRKHLNYSVTSEQEVRTEKFSTIADRIYRSIGPSGVVLMTCGDWNGSRYETTVIVMARAA